MSDRIDISDEGIRRVAGGWLTFPGAEEALASEMRDIRDEAKRQEREACAKIAESKIDDAPHDNVEVWQNNTARAIAAAIRARKD